MAQPTRTQLRMREVIELRVFEREVREGHKYREAKRRLEEAEERGDRPAALAMYRFMVALYSPYPYSENIIRGS